MPRTGSRATSTAMAPENGGDFATGSRPFGCETTITKERFDGQPILQLIPADLVAGKIHRLAGHAASTRGRHRHHWRKRGVRRRRRCYGAERPDHRLRHDLAVLVDLSDARWK